MSQKIKPVVTINDKWCKACGICIALCTKEVLEADDMGKAKVAKPEKCIGCRICELHCPDFAITVERGNEG